MRSSGADVVRRPGSQGLLQVDGIAPLIAESVASEGKGMTFSTLPVDRVAEWLSAANSAFKELPPEDAQWGLNARGVFAFKTREGARGLLEIVDETPQRARVRYKLVAPEAGVEPAVTSKRQSFTPTEGMAKDTSWTVFDKPSFLNPKGWALMSRMTLGGEAVVQLPGEKEPRCRIRLVEGSDNAIKVLVQDAGRNTDMILSMARDQSAEVTVEGRGYRVRYASVHVASNEPDSSPFAQVIVTPVET
jgi:hypothetical protein